MKSILYLILSISLMSLASASILCNTNTISQTLTQNQLGSQQITCSNNLNTTVSINAIGTFFTLLDNSISPLQQKTINISFNSDTAGLFQGAIIFNDSSPQVSVSLTVNQPQQTNTPIVFPTSKVINIQQGQTKSQSIQLIVPASYPRNIILQSVNFNPEIEIASFEDLNLGTVTPGQTVNIPLKINAVNAQTGTYSTQVNLMATDSNGIVQISPVSLQIIVSTGIAPITNDTFKSPPVCSLSAVSLGLNQTYAFNCNNVAVNNIQVNPDVNEYFQGISAEYSGSSYTYKFIPTKYGNTFFTAHFSYMGSPVYAPFSQEVRITSSGASIAGTNLKFLFTPSLDLAKDGDLVIVQLIDNKTGSLVVSPEIYVNAIPLSSNGSLFTQKFYSDVNYEFRGRSPGYDDIVQTYKLTSKQLNMTISPSSGESSTIFFINSSIENVSLFIDGKKVDYPFRGTLSVGNHTIQGIKQGFFDYFQNVSVTQSLYASLSGEFKSGTVAVVSLSKNASWTLKYKKDINSPDENIGSDSSDKVQFTPTKAGIYTVYANGQSIWSSEIKGWDGKIWILSWYWWVLIIIILIILILAKKKKSEAPFGGNVNYS